MLRFIIEGNAPDFDSISELGNDALGVDLYENSDQQVRLALDRPGRTIVANNFHFHPHQPRYLTVREAAAHQTFADDYRFFGGVVPAQAGQQRGADEDC